MNRLLSLILVFGLVAIASGEFHCAFYGDPHVRSFDGLDYDVYTVGDFTTVKAKAFEFEQQVRLEKRRCGIVNGVNTCSAQGGVANGQTYSEAGPAWTRDVAWIYKNNKLTFFGGHIDAKPGFLYNGNAVATPTQGQKAVSYGPFLVEKTNGVYRIEIPELAGLRLEVTYTLFNFIESRIWIPDSWKDATPMVSGLCGTPDGNIKNELIGRDGQLYDPTQDKGTHLGRANYNFDYTWVIPAGQSALPKPEGPNYTDFNQQVIYSKAHKAESAQIGLKWKSEEQKRLAEKVCGTLPDKYAKAACLVDIESGITDPQQMANLAQAEKDFLTTQNAVNDCVNLPGDIKMATEKLAALRADHQKLHDSVIAQTDAVAKAQTVHNQNFNQDKITEANMQIALAEWMILKAQSLSDTVTRAGMVAMMTSELAKWQKVLSDMAASKKAIDDMNAKIATDTKLRNFTRSRADAAQVILDELNRQKEDCKSVDNCAQLIPSMSKTVDAANLKVQQAATSVQNIVAKQNTASQNLDANKKLEDAAKSKVAAKDASCVVAKADSDKLIQANLDQILFARDLKSKVQAKMTDATTKNQLVTLLDNLEKTLTKLGDSGAFTKDYNKCLTELSAQKDEELKVRADRKVIEDTIKDLGIEKQQTVDLQQTLIKAAQDAQTNLNTNSARCKAIANARLGIKTLAYRGPKYFEIQVLSIGDDKSENDSTGEILGFKSANLLDVDN